MKKSLFVSLLCLISACTTLTGHERLVLRDLKSDGISVENQPACGKNLPVRF